MGDVSVAMVIFWAMIGVVIGALIAAFVARLQLTGVRRELLSRIRARDRVIERLKGMIAEMTSRAGQHDEVLAEVALLRRDRPALASDLEQARRTITEQQQALDAARAATRDVDLRLSAALDAERHENAARRAVAASELASAHESALNLRAELASARDTSSRTTVRLESDLAASRNLFERTTVELHTERAAASELRAELTDRIRTAEDERTRVESALTAAQRDLAEKSASLRSYVATLKEQYALATMERDVAAREADTQRTRAQEVEQQLEVARAEYASRLDEEHSDSVNLLSRVWDYVHNYPRLRERPVSPPPAPHAHPGAAWEEPATAPVTPAMPVTPVDAPPNMPLEREVPPAPAFLADSPRVEVEYDIEQAMAESGVKREPEVEHARAPEVEHARAHHPESARQREAEAAPAANADHALAGAAEPARSNSSDEGTIRVRRPVSAMRRENDVLVICDDGTVWSKRATGWVQQTPIPGSESELEHR